MRLGNLSTGCPHPGVNFGGGCSAGRRGSRNDVLVLAGLSFMGLELGSVRAHGLWPIQRGEVRPMSEATMKLGLTKSESRQEDEKIAAALGSVECDNWEWGELYFGIPEWLPADFVDRSRESCGHELCHPKGEPPRYTTNALDDHKALKRVKETWDEDMQEKWMDKLHDIIILRRDPGCNPDGYGTSIGDIIDYQLGDYGRAVLAAKEAEKSTDGS